MEEIMTSKDLLQKLTLTPGISGFEGEITQIMIDELGSKASYKKDKLGSIAFEFKGSSPDPKIMVVGHQDEIGFIVTHIQNNGLIKFFNIGGWDWRTLLSSPVSVVNTKGEHIHGIIGSVPVHFLRGQAMSEMKLEDMYIDIGAKSAEDAINNFNIRIGSPIIPITNYHFNEKNNLIFSKAFDDRVGVAVAIETGKHLANIEHPNTVYCSGSVQEEVGIRGAQTISNLLNPDFAVVVEGAPADDFPGNEHKAQTKLGNGVQIRIFDPTIVVREKWADFVINLAKERNIPHQIAVRTSGGTDAKVTHLHNIGVPSIVLAVPVRYAHSHNGIMSLDDYDACLSLVKAITETLDAKKYEEICS
jgi:endoglucanase